MKRTIALIATLAIGLASISAHAATITIQLTNHPDAALSSQGAYGLRLDQLNPDGTADSSGTNGPTFGALGNVFLEYDPMNLGAGATLTGSFVNNFADLGGNPDIWDVVYNLEDLVLDNGGFRAGSGSGTFTQQGGSQTVVQLSGKASGNDVFRILNDGHRLCDAGPGCTGLVARGWLYGKGTNDFLLTAVPIPGALWLFGSGLAGLVALRRRKLAQAA